MDITMKSILKTACLTLPLIMCCGCEDRLFVENLPRTQFERYDRLRGRIVPKEKRDVNGKFVPALRERLQPPL